MTDEFNVKERVRWRLLADATTDSHGLWEALGYGCKLLEADEEKSVIAILDQLANDDLIEFFLEEPHPPHTARGNLKKIAPDEVRAYLHDESFWNPTDSSVGHRLWYAATEKGEAAFEALTPSQARAIFDAGR